MFPINTPFNDSSLLSQYPHIEQSTTPHNMRTLDILWFLVLLFLFSVFMQIYRCIKVKNGNYVKISRGPPRPHTFRQPCERETEMEPTRLWEYYEYQWHYCWEARISAGGRKVPLHERIWKYFRYSCILEFRRGHVKILKRLNLSHSAEFWINFLWLACFS